MLSFEGYIGMGLLSLQDIHPFVGSISMKTAKKKTAKQTTRAHNNLRKRKEDIGLSPYAVVFRGQQRLENTLIRMMEFSETSFVERECPVNEEFLFNLSDSVCRWIAVNGIHDVKTLEKLAQSLKIPERILSDILNPLSRPRYEDFGDGLFMTLKLIQYSEKTDQLISENLSVIVLNNTLVTFREELDPVFDSVRERIRKPGTKIRRAGPDYLAFAVLDIVIDHYIYLLGVIGDRIETLDERLTEDPGKDLLKDINAAKQEINYLRKTIMPAKEMIVSINKQETEFIKKGNAVHFRELHYNINEAVDLTDSLREILYDQISVYHTILSSRQNEILRILTLFSVIFIPLTFIVGVYGTNFENFPELKWQYGYYLMWGVMILIGSGMLLYFRSRKWW